MREKKVREKYGRYLSILMAHSYNSILYVCVGVCVFELSLSIVRYCWSVQRQDENNK